MDGIATFLLGGAVGMALGYVASRRRSHKGVTSLPGRPLGAPPFVSRATVEEPAGEPAPDSPPSAVMKAETPPVETGEAERLALEARVSEQAPETEAIPVEEPLGEMLLDADIGTSAAEVVESEPLEEAPPLAEEESGLWEPAEVETEPVAVLGEIVPESAEVPAIDLVDMAPFEAAVAEVTELADFEPVESVVVAPSESVEVAPAESVEVVLAEPSPAEAAEMEAEIAAEATEPPVSSPMDDLKARIEETRRRIRRELEQPFISADEIEEEDDWTVSAVVPEVEEMAEGESGEETAGLISGEAEPTDGEAAGVEPARPEAADLLADTMAYDGEGEVVSEEAADYESVKSRIEVTRSRLKAKAFDAMMSGESALLGRDTESAQAKRPAMPAVDSEIDQTIETGLREQET